MCILGRQDADFWMPRHRHNFEQIRLPVRSDMNLGHGLVLREGEVGYFPEGTAYGPQEDALGDAAPGERVQLVLQFGGASGCGFMSIEQRRRAKRDVGDRAVRRQLLPPVGRQDAVDAARHLGTRLRRAAQVPQAPLQGRDHRRPEAGAEQAIA
ncbi:hypothetical protein OHT59_45940 [Streptomyces sp. NBC_00243]|uniref:hypothetical protein n=1 Tax=Streptomyces sp. NBC_00243 TaxID=2975688 RepID=UPI002DDB6749|nr:hypothetical protein [Streptomyces sp. NBC_00243]WRZ25355.1 hypothetical protein OHT59_45940 [Streptomyces sp. NBC_00243]